MLVSCAGSRQVLRVKQYHLRVIKVGEGQDAMERNEITRRLYGAVSKKEQEARRGDYYTILWSDRTAGGPVDVVLEYQQGATKSLVKRMARRFPAEDVSGKAEFSVIGNDFLLGGRVLCWKVSLLRGGRVVASRQSYLWQ